ncbi:MAG: RNA polymerase factor sigma-54 [Verrucomicrobiae bacterium]|nr:RNA polymerase factor sigma-54 [Verrucomicrobiae bacterium]
MEFGFQQRLQQSIAPQMQQSLQLLQASAMELQSLVQQELQANPVLEESLEEPESAEEKEDSFDEEFETLSRLDDDWDSTQSLSRNSHGDDEEKRNFMLESLVEPESLQQHLMGQLPLSPLSADQMPVAELIIGNIDDRGFLQTPLEELYASSGTPIGIIEEVLRVIQGFHPVGVGARDLRECLLLQLDRLGMGQTVEARIVSGHLEALSQKKFPEIARALKVPVGEIQRAAHFIATLTPRPGALFSTDSNQYVIPDLEIRKVDGEYIILLNDRQIPHLRISNTYKDLMAGEHRAEVKEYIREKIRAGKFLIKSIHQRQQTIGNIAREILTRQREFFDQGISRLKPMTMAQVATAVGVHETTVSRAIANKYIQTPHGVFDLKFFFTPGFRSDSGESVSNSSVKDAIADLIKNENTHTPLSDMEIVDILKDRGIPIARRTVAKYRGELGILPSNLRKEY